MSVSVLGNVAPGFEKIRDVFADGFVDYEGMGAALSIWLEGENVANLWGGSADERDARPWDQETATVIFSCTKGLMSIIAADLVARDLLDYASPVAKYWPEFAAEGKQHITVAEVLSHRAGLSAPRTDFTSDDLLNWDYINSELAAQIPLWRRGDGYAYHALTHGWLVGELVRRVTGQTPGQLFQELIASPLNVPAWIGLPSEEQKRVAHIQVSTQLKQLWKTEAGKKAPNWPFKAMTLGNALPSVLVTDSGGFNSATLHQAEIPGAGGIATADALATIWSSTVVKTKGVRLLDDRIIAKATETQSYGPPFFDAPAPYSRWGMGFQLDSEARRYGGPNSFGHDGAGGQVGFADPDRRIGFGFVTNAMDGPVDTRATDIITTLQQLL